MQTTIEFLDAVKAAHGLTSDYQLAQLLGIERQAISHYRAGRTLGDETAIRVAELLEVDWAYVVACIHAERAKAGDAKKLWARLAKQLAPAVLAILAGCALVLAPLPGLTPDASAASAPGLYIMLSTLLMFLSAWRALPYPHHE